MQRLLASLTIVLLLGMMITRVLLMRRSGILTRSRYAATKIAIKLNVTV
jgi:hypothetical protein